MTLVPKLEAELVEVARRAAGATSARRRLRPPILVLAIVSVLVLATVGIAAGGLLDNGKPVKPPGHQRSKANEGMGVIKPGSAQVLPITVPDPGGGLPWGLRYVETTRGLGCMQVGRLQDGQLGVVGQDGAFRNDGRFHPFVPSYLGSNFAGGPFPCGLLDAHGHAFASVTMHGTPASGLMVPSATNMGCVSHRDSGPIGKRPNQPQICPRKDWRLIYVGMAGPEAERITYVAGGSEHTVATVGEQGAFLIVLPVNLKRHHGLNSFSSLPGVGGGSIVRVEYRNGYVCRRKAAPDNGSSLGMCPNVGQVPVPHPRLTPADVAAPIKTSIRRASFGPEVVASFVARVPVTDANSAYGGFLELSGTGVNCSGGQGGDTRKNIAVGERVYFRFPTQGCHGRFHGTITYEDAQSGIPGQPLPVPDRNALIVGHFTVNVP